MKTEAKKSKYHYLKTVFIVVFLLLWIAVVVYLPLLPYNILLDRWDGSTYRPVYDLDFRCFLVPGHMIRHGLDRIYDFGNFQKYWFMTEINQGEPGSITYPPSFYFIMTLFTYMPLYWATDLWLFSKYIIIFWTAILMTYLLIGEKAKSWKKILLVVFLSITLYSFSPTLDDVLIGQINVHILFLMTLSLYLVKREHPIPAGLLLGFVFSLKLMSAFVILYFIIRKRWKIVIPAVAVILLINLAVFVVVGKEVFVNYFQRFPVDVETARFLPTPSIPARIMYITRNRDIINNLYKIIALIFVAAAFYRTVFTIKKNHEVYVYSLLMAFTVIVSPIVWPTHHVWLTLPLVFIFRDILKRDFDRPMDWALAVVVSTIYFLMALLDGYNGFWDKEIRFIFFDMGIPFTLPILLWCILYLYPPERLQAVKGNHADSGKEKQIKDTAVGNPIGREQAPA